MASSYSLLPATPKAETGVKVTVCIELQTSNEGYPKVREYFTITEKALLGPSPG